MNYNEFELLYNKYLSYTNKERKSFLNNNNIFIENNIYDNKFKLYKGINKKCMIFTSLGVNYIIEFEIIQNTIKIKNIKYNHYNLTKKYIIKEVNNLIQLEDSFIKKNIFNKDFFEIFAAILGSWYI